MLNIHIKSVPHSSQRYETCGDWYRDKNNQLVITISELGDWKKEILIAIHELVEVVLCDAHGITQEVVDNFDIMYEAARHPSDLVSEPGDDPRAPYHKEHFNATTIERYLCELLGVSWKEYEDAIYALSEK